jgi:hypothetical protein
LSQPKSRRDRLIKNILSGITGPLQNEEDSTTKDMVLGLLSKAGRSKDEVIQILGREIGLALAAVLAKPLEQMTENKRIKITLELEAKHKKPSAPQGKKKTGKTK